MNGIPVSLIDAEAADLQRSGTWKITLLVVATAAMVLGALVGVLLENFQHSLQSLCSAFVG